MPYIDDEIKAISISKNMNDMQWPCDYGFHIPTSAELIALYNVWENLWIWSSSNWNWFKTYLKMPFAWYRDYPNWNAAGQSTDCFCYSCIGTWNNWTAYALYFASSYIWPTYNLSKCAWAIIRPFKDEVVIPDSSWTVLYQGTWDAWVYHNSTLGLISLSSDWTTWITIADKNCWATTVYNSWDTLSEANCGKYFQWGNNYWFAWTWSITTSSTKINASSYWPWNYYSSSTFITSSSAPHNWDTSDNQNLRWWVTQQTWLQDVEIKKVSIYKNWVENQIRPWPLTIPWVYHNAALWLISLSSDWENWVTIADKNLWATTAYNDWDALSESNCGNYFQWWNNYAFPFTWSVSTATWKVNVQSYWPNNYYSSSLFYINSDWSWTTTNNIDLWWDSTDTLVARRWPCDSGYHIWTKSEYENILSILQSLSILPSGRGDYIKQYLKMPYSWNRNYNNGNTNNQWNYWIYWTSSTTGDYSYQLSFYQWYWGNPSGNYREQWVPIRPLKNEAVQPDNTWTVLFEKTALKFTANTANSTVQLTKTGSPTSVTLETSTDLKNWSSYNIWDTITLSNIWDKVFFRNTSETDTRFSIDGSNYYKFVMSWSISASWDTTSLLNKNWTNTLSDYCFYYLFYQCSSLTTAPLLLATTLGNRCYTNMFFQCTWLTTPPELPATTLTPYCYSFMFSWCTWLTTAPSLLSTSLAEACYYNMFSWCTSITTIPRFLATTFPNYCCSTMFYWCSNIKMSTTKTWIYQTSYRIPRTWTGSVGANSFYNMFGNTWGTFTGTASINQTYYTSNTVV